MRCVVFVRCATIRTCSGHDYPPPSPEQVLLECHIVTLVSCTLRPILRRYPGKWIDRCLYVKYTYICYPVPNLPFPTYHPSEGTGSLFPIHILDRLHLYRLVVVPQEEGSCRWK